MTIKSFDKFFWNSFQKNLYAIKLVFFLGICLVLFATARQNRSAFLVISFKTETGWGYKITDNEKVIIKQSIIPVISQNKSFSSEEEALKTGEFVKEKLQSHQSPTLTKNDLLLLGIKI
ncbi:DUF4907 domain-containing protein [Flavobacterium sp. SE-1-e]|uniref:DUF4907 domain-containing protein n=2 Tax=Flavobacterium agrisoli TaxID=2793066 RepID=A0A934PNT5_9FLAO|nr:DUF4907 domain-containing protein [Flavobacterium agrisoli]